MATLVIGSGIAGVTFAEKYRSLQPDQAITLITLDQHGYYSRPLLSRGFTKDDIETSIILKSYDKLRSNQIDVWGGTEALSIDRNQHTLTVKQAGRISVLPYERLILAPGSAAFIPPPYRPFEKLFFSLNNLADLKAMRRFRESFLQQGLQPHWGVIGGGLIGCEIASDLATAGDKVSIYHLMDRLMERQLQPEDSEKLLKVLENSGVQVLLNQTVQSFGQQESKFSVTTEQATACFDSLIVACGFKPRIELAQAAGLKVNRGIQVNDYLQTEDDYVFALGDAAELPNGKIYAYILPIRSQANWLASFIAGQEQGPWQVPSFIGKAKVHGFEPDSPMLV